MEDRKLERAEPVKAADGERESDNRKSRRKVAAVERKTLDEIDSTIDRKVAVITGNKIGKTSAAAAMLAAGAMMQATGEALAEQISAPFHLAEKMGLPVQPDTDYSGDIPDRVSINPKSRFYFAKYRGLGVKISGYVRKADVEEFCVSEGWALVRVPDARGRFKTERGKFLTTKIKGLIEPFWQGK